jgi:2-dehydropantoate 2-reductase
VFKVGRFGVLGAGALGCFYGGRLAAAGYEVSLHVRQAAWREAIQQRGLKVSSIDGDFQVQPVVVTHTEEFEPLDLLIIGLKATVDLGTLVALLRPVLVKQAPKCPVLFTLQNGLGNEEMVAEACDMILGRSEGASVPIAGGIAFLCSNRGEPGHVIHSAHGWIKAGWHRSPIPFGTVAIVDAFARAGLSCEWVDSLLAARYEKLVWNIPFNGLGVAAGANVADVLESPRLRELARTLMMEVVATAQAEQCSLPSGVVEDMMQRSRAMGPYRTSMQIDHELGRPLEIRSILGEPLGRANQWGVPVPALEVLFTLVQSRARLFHGRAGGYWHAG